MPKKKKTPKAVPPKKAAKAKPALKKSAARSAPKKLKAVRKKTAPVSKARPAPIARSAEPILKRATSTSARKPKRKPSPKPQPIVVAVLDESIEPVLISTAAAEMEIDLPRTAVGSDQQTPDAVRVETVSVLLIELDPEAVGRRAFEIWASKGYPDNDPAENWHQAEAELRAEAQKRMSDGL